MILTNAVSGIARSGATRSGYPVLQGAVVPLYALSNVARSGATRSNYVGSRAFINIGGIDYGWGGVVDDGVGILAESLTKADAINNTPVTLQFTARGWVPVEGSDVVVTLGSKNNQRREFGGTILSTRHRYVGDRPVAENMLYDVSCIDYTWALDNRKVSGNYTTASVAAVAASLLTFAPAGYTLRVDPDIGAELLDQITFTEQTLSSALVQLAKRVGGDFLCDFAKVVHLFFENTALTPPTIVNAVHPSLANIAFTRDLSQVATRVLGNFGGSNALEQVAPGDIWIPVETAAWYLPGGGVVLVGQQRVTYGGIVVGGGGSLVGPGAAPTGAPNAALLPGAGVDVGSHDYAVTFKTASGESIAGPRITVPVGLFLAPPTAPTAGAPGPGAGPDPGVHDYAVSFVISTGETVPGPRTSVSTGLLSPPDTGPTPDRVDAGLGPDPGTHDYAVAFVTATGATPAGPIGSQITTGVASPPSSGPSGSVSVGAGPDAGSHAYACTFLPSGGGETTAGPVGPAVQTGSAGPAAAAPTSSPSVAQYPNSGNYTPGNGGGNVGDTVIYSVTYTNDGTWTDESAMGPGSPPIQIQAYVGGPPNQCLRTVSIGAPPGGVAGFRLYVSVNGMTPAILTWFYTSNYPSGVSGYVVSGMPTQGWYPGPGHGPIASVVNVGNIPTSGGAARKLYRQSGGAGLRLVATLDGSSTSYTDTKSNASLGAAPPGTNTAYAQTVHLSGIPTGPNGVTGRALYRRSGGQGLRWVTTISGNSTTTYTDTTPNASLGGAPQGTSTATLQQIPLTAIPVGNSLVTARKLYRTPANTGGGTLKLVATLADNTTTAFTDTVPDASLGAAALTVSTAQAAQVQLGAIPVGAPAVIARNLYRTKAGAGQLQLRATINDNTTQTFLDTAADATLGANVPTSDTSLLAQPAGNVLIGSPSLPCATVAGFLPSGGWVTAGSQNLRYTGISGTNLIGIPPSGPGAILATLSYNTTIVQAAMLNGIPTTGLGVIKYPILKGDPVNIFVQVDDLAAQAAVRVQLPGSDGIIEDEIQDGRLSYTEGRARCQARLDLLAELDSEGKVGVIAVSYVCRDINTIAGATATINLGPPINLRGDFLIQRVGVAQFHIPNLHPTYTVEASSIRFSAEEMLRLLRQGAL